MLLFAAGCGQLFGLRDLPVPLIDASFDAPIDAPCAGHDEDGDGRGDACDNCPIDVNDGTNRDGDELGDLCDPHPAIGGDKLTLFSSFVTQGGWTSTGTVTFDGDNAEIQGTSLISTNYTSADVVEVPVTLSQGISATDVFFVYLITTTNALECRIHPGPCADAMGSSCLLTRVNTSPYSESPIAASLLQIARVEVDRGIASATCRVRTADGTVVGEAVESVALAGGGNISLAANNGMVAVVHSTAMYGL